MKKIVWVFGESATGKYTLINKLYNQDELALKIFNMGNKKLSVSRITLADRNYEYYGEVIDNNVYDDLLMDDDNLYFSRESAKRRRSYILHDVEEFINSDKDVLLIKGQINDLRENRGNTATYFLKKYANNPNLEIEVIILQVEDSNELRRRLECKKWFNQIEDVNEKNKLLRTIPLKQEEHKEEVIDLFNDYNVSILVYESLENSYQLNEIINNIGGSYERN